MHMQDDPVTARLDIEDCVREQVAGYRLCQVLGQLPTVHDGSEQFASLTSMGVFSDATSERILEESEKGILASL